MGPLVPYAYTINIFGKVPIKSRPVSQRDSLKHWDAK